MLALGACLYNMPFLVHEMEEMKIIDCGFVFFFFFLVSSFELLYNQKGVFGWPTN